MADTVEVFMMSGGYWCCENFFMSGDKRLFNLYNMV